ncbi:MAG: archaellin/type IV pilin N-terminal domain-containing protein [Thermoplasmata archaeon]
MSPIIATILLVAITVVLAAVLYVLISGLTHGPGSTPLGTTYGFGSATQQTGTGTSWCAAGHQCWEVSISAASGPTVSEMSFVVKTASGSALPLAKISIVILNQTEWAIQVNGAATWTPGAGVAALSTSTTVSPTMEIWVDSGVTAATATAAIGFGTGDTITAYGSGSYTGSVGPTALP